MTVESMEYIFVSNLKFDSGAPYLGLEQTGRTTLGISLQIDSKTV
jgi:hypothetical protein